MNKFSPNSSNVHRRTRSITQFDYINSTEEQSVARVKSEVYFWMLFEHFKNPGSQFSWSIDSLAGVQSIAWGAAMSIGKWETDLMSRHISAEPKGDYGIWLRDQARCYVNSCFLAIRELIGEGQIEVTLEYGWPALRLPHAAADGVRIFHNGSSKDRAIQLVKRIDELRSMPYPEYLQSPEWQERRQLHLNAAGNRCQLCNSPEQPLHVHHRTYANRARERFYDLVVLCASCHETFHKSGRKVR